MSHRFAQRLPEIVVPVLIVVALTVIIGLVGGGSLRVVLVGALVNLVLVVGLYVFNGNSGVFSFGQMAFMMVGAYAGALVSIAPGLKTSLLPNLLPAVQNFQLDIWGAVLVGGALAAVCAFVVGFPLMRMSGLQAGIASLALLLVAQNVAARWKDVTNGTATLVGIPVDLNPWNALIICVAVMVIAYTYQRSRFGLRLRAGRDDELAAVASAVRLARERHIAFILSAFICGVGGAMNAHYLGALNANLTSFFDPTFLTIAMLVIGGVYSLSGTVIGTLFVSVVVELLRQLQSGWNIGGLVLTIPIGADQAVLGILLLLTIIWRPTGITGGQEFALPRRWRWRSSRAASPSIAKSEA